jgi:adenine-specific DNA-methyltransferase
MNLGIFSDINLYSASADLFQQLGIKLNSNTSEPLPIEGLLKQHLKETEIFKSINQTFFIGIIDDSVFQQISLFKGDYSYTDALQQADKSYEGLMFFALELAKHPTRTEISELTRAFNRISQKMPVALILKYKFEKETSLSITISERFKYKQNWRQGEKAGKVIILRDVKTINTHAGHQRILLDLVKPVGVSNYSQLHEHWLHVLDVSVLNKQFYQKLFNWYLWALTKAEFPQIRPEEDKINNDVHQSESLIRLLSRLLFCWFMKEKGLINPNLFNIDYLRKTLKDFEGIKSDDTIYYKAILQNLFFATLNKPIDERKIIDKGFNKKEYGDPLVYRYEELFKDDKSVLSHFENIPFLNGGLFDCLDQKKDKDNPVEIRLDGFSTKKDKQPIMPDMFFFGEYDGIDLSEEYDDKRKNKVKVFGLLDILHQYKFTIEENTPLEEEIALDPELLGKVFENLLASYNPETKTTARKQTGSFYTPREIVNYMVDESLLSHLRSTVDDEVGLRILFSYNETVNPFDKKETRALIEAINSTKILDPACGSGAFPMGVLQKLIHILHKLDPKNKIWFELVIANFPSAMQNVARQRLEKENWNFVRKLGIIQECIYGVDIQPIAIQISKLRFFISLLVDQTERPKDPNRGFEPLPNLDFKLVAANTLISAPESDEIITGLFSGQTDSFFYQLDILTNEYFNVHSPSDKKDKKRELLRLIDDKISEKQRQLKRAMDVKNKKQTDAEEIKINVWKTYANLFKQEAVGFFETKYFFPKVAEGFHIVIGNPPYVRADNPVIAALRKNIIESGKYVTLWEKWDLYVAFIEKGFSFLRKNGKLSFIIPDAYIASKYAEKSHAYFIKNANIDRINFCSTVKIFDAAVKNIIIQYSKNINPQNIPLRIQHVNSFENEINLNSGLQSELDANTFKIAQKNSLFEDIPNSKKWEEICYVSKGMVLQSDENNYKGQFTKEDLISDIKDKIHPKKYLEAKWIKRYEIEKIKYLEWNTDRVPDKISRPTFPDLYNHTKIIMGGMTGAFLDDEGFLCNHSCSVSVLWKDLSNVNNLSINNSVRKDFKIKGDKKVLSRYRKLLEDNSNNYSLRYLLAILNSKFGYYYLDTNRRSQMGFYPDDLKQLPIIFSNDKIQSDFGNVVEFISFLKSVQKDITFFIRIIDLMVYELYLPEAIRTAGCNVLEHLTNLPALNEEWDAEQKLTAIEKVYKQLSNPSHPVSSALLKLLNVAEVKTIEGIK